jgi:hypothetical protein
MSILEQNGKAILIMKLLLLVRIRGLHLEETFKNFNEEFFSGVLVDCGIFSSTMPQL